MFAPTGREILGKRLQGSDAAEDLSYQAAAHLDTPELFMARAAGYGNDERVFLERPDVAGALELVRQFHVQGMQAKAFKRVLQILKEQGLSGPEEKNFWSDWVNKWHKDPKSKALEDDSIISNMKESLETW